ncbi:c-type cytochrome [Salinibius halmophilus]|uniref:c-type cytochrome n=1 Tax=Salinibius halmophilus TaxID=1853216 RepID=UPI000E67085E|nr:c-type cytochrome [Salinibius halmophilus]
MRVKLLIALVALFGLGTAAYAATDDDHTALIERLQKAGEVCADDSCGSAAMVASGPMTGDEVYQNACFACHGNGTLGAPILGNAEQWAPRIEQGLETLVRHAVEGFNAMPAMGGCADCDEDDIANAVEYMVAESQ